MDEKTDMTPQKPRCVYFSKCLTYRHATVVEKVWRGVDRTIQFGNEICHMKGFDQREMAGIRSKQHLLFIHCCDELVVVALYRPVFAETLTYLAQTQRMHLFLRHLRRSWSFSTC
jgi:hypothetical protein